MTYERAGVDSEDIHRAHGLLRAVDVRVSLGTFRQLSPYPSHASMILSRHCEEDWLCVNFLVGGLFSQ